VKIWKGIMIGDYYSWDILARVQNAQVLHGARESCPEFPCDGDLRARAKYLDQCSAERGYSCCLGGLRWRYTWQIPRTRAPSDHLMPFAPARLAII
jgi:hypothetical protein